MTKQSIRLICLSILLFQLTSPIKVAAYTLSDAKSATVSASVPSQNIDNDTTAPSPPILIRPEDGTITNDNRREFVWRQSTDTGGNTIIYTLYLNGISTYLGISNLGNSSGNNYTARLDGDEIRLSPTISLPDGVYDWYVTASDLAGNTSHSATWHLTIDTSPPPLTLVDLDTYHTPHLEEGTNFDIDGPKTINFTILSDPYATIQLTLKNEDASYRLSAITSTDGLAYFTKHLGLGIYTVTILAIDQAGNTTVLPEFTITISQAQVVISLPPIPGIAATIKFPYTPLSIPSLPATIAKLETRDGISYVVVLLLAVGIGILLIFLWKRRYNILILDTRGDPVREATIYHAIPEIRDPKTHILMTSQEPATYDLIRENLGHLYVRHLNRYSTLTICVNETTYLLSLCRHRSSYTLILG